MAKGALAVDPARAAAIKRKEIRDAKRVAAKQGAMSKDPTLNQTTEQQMQKLVGDIGNVQQFSPGDYAAQREAANAAVMDSFSRRMDPQFQREQQEFDQRMAETGNPVGSENYETQLKLLRQSQGDQRLNAQNQAYLTGQGEQAQGYNQGANTWGLNSQLPMQQYSTLMPWMQQQNQQVWQGGQNALDRKTQTSLANIGANASRSAASSGALTYDQRLGLIAAESQANAVANGYNLYKNTVPKTNTGNAIANGIAAGVGAGLGGAMR